MTPKEAYEVLREFQMWSREKGKYEGFYKKFPYTPKEVEKSINVAVNTFLAMMKKEAEQ